MFSRFIQLLCFDLIFPANGARYFLSLSLLLPFSLFISLEYKREDCILLDLERSSEFNRRSLDEEEEDETKSLCDLSPSSPLSRRRLHQRLFDEPWHEEVAWNFV